MIVDSTMVVNVQFETGVHRVQRIPVTESHGRVHTSTMTVAILPVPTEVTRHPVLTDTN